jgi:hypothetical protein
MFCKLMRCVLTHCAVLLPRLPACLWLQGFLPNVRQQRAAGYAALQLAQTVRALLAERKAGREGLWVNRCGRHTYAHSEPWFP